MTPHSWSGVIQVSGRPYLHPQHSQACALSSDGGQANVASIAAWFHTDKGKARSFLFVNLLSVI